MQKTPSVKAVIRTDKQLVNGNFPIYIQIIINSQKKLYSLSENIELNCWDKKNGLTTGKGNSLINDKINMEISAFKTFFSANALAKNTVTFLLIAKFLKNQNDENFYKIFDEIIQKKKDLKFSADTIYKYETLRARLKLFKPQISVADITYSFITKFDVFLKKMNYGIFSEWNHHKCFKALINEAIQEEIVDFVQNPYSKFKMPTLPKKIVFLQVGEVVAIENYFSICRNTEICRHMFLLSCYTGLRYSDLRTLLVSHIDLKKGFIKRIMYKTKTSVTIPVNEKIIKLLDLYLLNKDKHELVFPKISNQFGNRLLKNISEKCEIQKNITFHVGRHTFASYLINDCNISLPIVSSLLGHKNFNTTMIYIHSNPENLKYAMSKVNYRLN